MLKNIKISSELKELCPNLTLGYINAEVVVKDYIPELWAEIEEASDNLKSHLKLSEISQLKPIKAAREVYRSLGKDPTRYRLSSEALIRRILKGQKVYQVNNIVDINNLVSLSSFYSIGSYNLARVGEEIVFRVGREDEEYYGIGRGLLNIDNLPVLSDNQGSFGSATSDSERTMITSEAKIVLLNVISFGGDESLSEALDHLQLLLEKYAGARNIQRSIVD